MATPMRVQQPGDAARPSGPEINTRLRAAHDRFETARAKVAELVRSSEAARRYSDAARVSAETRAINAEVLTTATLRRSIHVVG